MTVSLEAGSPFGIFESERSHASESRTIRYFFTPSRLASIVATHFGLFASRDYVMEILLLIDDRIAGELTPGRIDGFTNPSVTPSWSYFRVYVW